MIDVIGETEHFVTLPWGRKEAKRAAFKSVHDSFSEAKAFLVENAERDVEAALLNLKRAEGRLDRLRGMREQEGVDANGTDK